MNKNTLTNKSRLQILEADIKIQHNITPLPKKATLPKATVPIPIQIKHSIIPILYFFISLLPGPKKKEHFEQSQWQSR